VTTAEKAYLALAFLFCIMLLWILYDSRNPPKDS
jgi:hypothetical protein